MPWFERRWPERKWLVNYGLRYTVVLITCESQQIVQKARKNIFIFLVALAAAIPRLDLFISLVGAASSSTLALMAPSLIETITFWPNMGKYRWKLVKNILIFLFGFLGFVTGSYISIKNIIKYFVTGE